MTRTLLSTLALLTLAACLEPANPRQIDSPDGPVGEVVAANNAFAVDLYQEVAAEEDGNVFLSPFSVSAAFGMTLAGTEGDTEAEMMEVLHIDRDEAEFHESFGALLRDVSGDQGRPYTLAVANRLFGQDGYPFEADFLTVITDDYDAPLEVLDFIQDPSGSRNTINTWVEDNTLGHIVDLLPESAVTPDTRLVLANAIAFQGDWATSFDPADTKAQDFTRLDDSVVSVDMMRASMTAELGGDEDASVLRLPYSGDDLSMVVVLPEDPGGVRDLEASMTPESLDALLGTAVEREEAMVVLPRFEFSLKSDLIPYLMDLGMELAFDCTQADFTGLTDAEHAEGLCITGAYHEAFVSVDEAGTEAAAATAVVVGYESAVEPVSFVANHPFLFLIRDDLTGSILFMGRVADPSA